MSNSVYRFNYFVACQHFFPWVDLAMKLYLLHYRSGQFLLLKNISVFFFFLWITFSKHHGIQLSTIGFVSVMVLHPCQYVYVWIQGCEFFSGWKLAALLEIVNVLQIIDKQTNTQFQLNCKTIYWSSIVGGSVDLHFPIN